jgi:hypothetical protein
VASYDASINVRVSGTSMVEGVINRVQELERLVRDINTRPVNLARPFGRGEMADRFSQAARELNGLKNSFINSERAVQDFGTTSGRTVANTTQLARAFKQIADNSDIATAQFREFTVATQQAAVAANSLGRARLSTLANELSFGGRQGQTIGGGTLVQELLAQRRQIPNSISALEAYQSELIDLQRIVRATSPEFRQLERAVYQLDVALGRAGQFGPAAPPVQGPALPPGFTPPPATPRPGVASGARGGPRPGSLDFNPNPSAENLALGAGFPLLFGGGPAQVLGGLAGSAFGSGFGGQILGSAIAQQLNDALLRVKEIGAAANQLNMDKLRESTVYVNAELETSIRLLVEAGKTEEARTMAIEEAAAALALTPDAMKDINNATNALNGEWDQFVGAISGTLSILGAPFAAALTGILRIVTMALTGFNMINTYIFRGVKGFVDWLAKLLNIKSILDKIGSFFGRRSEQQEKEIAALTATNDKLLREVQTRKQILDLEAQRTLGRTEAEKLINAELTKQQAQIKIKAEYDEKELAIRNEIGTKSAAQLALAIRLNSAAENQALKEQAIKDLLVLQGLEIEANAKKYSLAADAVQRQIDALERGSQVRQSQFAVESALNDLYGAQLQRQYEVARTASERYRIALLQFQQQVKAAVIEYKLALANNQILIEKAVLQTKLVELKYKEVAAEKEIAIAQAGARGNTPEQIAAIAGSYDKALGVQREVLQSAYDQQKATIQIARNQDEVAKAVFQTKLIQAESTLAQKLTSDEIGMSKIAADNLAYSLRISAQETFLVEQKVRGVVGAIDVGTQRTVIFARAMSNVAAAANDAAYNINRAFQNQLKLNQARSAQPASAPVRRAAEGAFWSGGFRAFAQGGMVTKPTLGLVGEGGESEYIIPSSKMAVASANYLAGGRGAGILEGGSGGGSAPSINITTGPVVEFNGERYVTMRDMERGLQQMATNIYTGLRTPAGRYAVGTR